MPSRFSTKITYYFENKIEIKKQSLDSDRDLPSNGLPAPGGQAGWAQHTAAGGGLWQREHLPGPVAKERGRNRAELRAGSQGPGEGKLWFPSSFFLGIPQHPQGTPSLGTLTLSLLPSLHMGLSFRRCYYSIECLPGLRQGWSYREREE